MKKYELASFGLTIAALSASAGAQSDPVGAAQLQAVPAPQAAPLAPATPVAPVAPPVVQWNRAAAQDLLSYLDTVQD